MNNQTVRIATWNLERPRINGSARNARLMDSIRRIDADIWILTETNAVIVPESTSDPVAKYLGLPTSPRTFHKTGENCTTVWSRFGIKQSIPTFDRGMAVCAEIETPLGPFIVYGTLITYAGDKGEEGISKAWGEHRLAARGNAADWAGIRNQYPGHWLCVAGDFNQNRDGTRWYCDPEAEATVTQGLKAAGMRCVTEHDIRREFGIARANIDHICVSDALNARVGKESYWMEEGVSDHNGVVVDVSLPA